MSSNGYFYAILEDGSLYGWGIKGQWLGVGDGISTWYVPILLSFTVYLFFSYLSRSTSRYPVYTPVNLSAVHNFPHGVRQITGGQSHTIAILTDGTLWGWGSIQYGEAGIGAVWPLFFSSCFLPVFFLFSSLPNKLQQNSTGYIAKAAKLSPDTDWYDIYSSPNEGFYTFAQKNDGTENMDS
jgi:hypothetical protein